MIPATTRLRSAETAGDRGSDESRKQMHEVKRQLKELNANVVMIENCGMGE